ncbi:hypothetical protein SAMN05428989_2950 [Pseudoxanthomonas sp. GM95]|uniref:hypothetical protein n=1 Tax=Pseudoxanthomonas sp. GM95 TaxID=1881043 RepID=UPI0008D1608E|nr:hypothetical protein [Pseudoxanthomonas sp. GM95]SEL94632.1 hypothetical protein SAMN05428989_2950 [Pseudoxanthomonas sp. GM95]
MKTRHVYAAENLAAAHTAIQAALDAGVAHDDVSLIAKGEIEMEAVPDSLKEAETDFKQGALRGAVGGGAAGLVAGLIGVAVPPLGLTLAGAGALALAGAAVGTWSAALVGSSVSDPVRRTFEEEIEAGRVLVVVDAEPVLLEQADAAVIGSGVRALPYEQPTALN